MSNPNLEEVEAPPPTEFVKLNRIEKPRPMFFYQKLCDYEEYDDQGQVIEYPIFACSEVEAAGLKSTKRYRFKQIGYSDGRAYWQYLRTHIQKGKIYPIEEAKQIMRDAEAEELKVARGHLKRPSRGGMEVVSISSDVAHPEDFIREPDQLSRLLKH